MDVDLALINGNPGSGKSTIAHALAQDRSMTLAVNIDGLKHSLGRWVEDPSASGLHARRLTLAGPISSTLDTLRGALRTPMP